MPVPLISGPFEGPGLFSKFPSAPAGCLLVVEQRREELSVIMPISRPGLKDRLRLGRYYLVRRRSGVNDDIHLALAEDMMVQFRIQYSFTLQLNEFRPRPSTPGDSNSGTDTTVTTVKRVKDRQSDTPPGFTAKTASKTTETTTTTEILGDAPPEPEPPAVSDPGQVEAAAIEAVRYYSQHADPVPLFRARLRQQLNQLSRMVDTSGTGRLYDAVARLAPHPQIPPPAPRSGDDPLPVMEVPVMSGMRVCLEQYVVSPRPRKFSDAA